MGTRLDTADDRPSELLTLRLPASLADALRAETARRIAAAGGATITPANCARALLAAALADAPKGATRGASKAAATGAPKPRKSSLASSDAPTAAVLRTRILAAVENGQHKQNAIAARARVQPAIVSKIVRNGAAHASADTRAKIAAALDALDALDALGA